MTVDQREFWNSDAAQVWIDLGDHLDEMLRPLGESALTALAPRPGEQLLDVGCGAGDTTRALAARVGPTGRVVGVDVSSRFIEVARRKGGGPAYVVADVERDPLPEGPFDGAFSRFGVMFFDDPTAAFTRLRATLRPGGRLSFLCWRALLENAWARQPMAAVLPLLKAPPPELPPDAPGPFAFADPDRVRRILDGAGWSGVAITPFDPGYLLGPTPDVAVMISLRLGPLGRLIREQQLDPEPIRRVLVDLLARHVTDRGVVMQAACWVVTATA